jgi:TctA family transporter
LTDGSAYPWVQTGPLLMVNNPEALRGVMLSMYAGNLMPQVLNLPSLLCSYP